MRTRSGGAWTSGTFTSTGRASLRACSFGVRAIQFDYGSSEYLNLELFLAKRAEGVLIETPAIRK